MTQRLQSRTWSWLTKITGTAIVTTVVIYCLADAYAALPRLVFGIIATTYVLLIGTILLSTRQVRHLHLAVMTWSACAKHAEAECDRRQQELEQHSKLKQELVKVKHITETSVLAKGEFLAAMNHQIRTPPK
ncbi:hypothetical protein [Xylella fastidiosa]|uniref:Uncharacterized protein n=1 Tax=Xylella fastidiosa (strain 9a5c) TaxID=160492 RepID=Q9PGA2_XYLFA|nr:hypothetical protein [Xylella fastidiosa]AAF83210.1 hypothetical protein XF_0400 [Xylella fastidiosa 9a5c]ARO67959.1 hypothetical protein B9J09_01760 [Xylella fastidiosa subsp. pauca]AVI20145.1 hypothetical protein BCV75_01670 [Xylella fastidiosa]AVI22139.1 hypothetical protein BC375_01675 [Xylella fastidiosa]ETE35600.1 hypothetical protein B398_01740 [Xylella fastidiosa 32]